MCLSIFNVWIWCGCVCLHWVSAGTCVRVCVCVCVCVVYGVLEPGVCYSLYSHTVFHQGPSCSPQTLSIQFHSLGPLSAGARGWMISNTWEPWEPTQRWNNRGPVSIRAWKRTRRQAVMMSESFTPTHASSALPGSQSKGRMHSCRNLHKCKTKLFCMIVQTNFP